MKSKMPLIACLLALTFFLQINHAALSIFSSHHKNIARDSSACRVLCIVEQTNKNTRDTAPPSPPVFAKKSAAPQSLANPTATLVPLSQHLYASSNDWISTVVQRK